MRPRADNGQWGRCLLAARPECCGDRTKMDQRSKNAEKDKVVNRYLGRQGDCSDTSVWDNCTATWASSSVDRLVMKRKDLMTRG